LVVFFYLIQFLECARYTEFLALILASINY
jgi:hypothetical protein